MDSRELADQQQRRRQTGVSRIDARSEHRDAAVGDADRGLAGLAGGFLLSPAMLSALQRCAGNAAVYQAFTASRERRLPLQRLQSPSYRLATTNRGRLSQVADAPVSNAGSQAVAQAGKRVGPALIAPADGRQLQRFEEQAKVAGMGSGFGASTVVFAGLGTLDVVSTDGPLSVAGGGLLNFAGTETRNLDEDATGRSHNLPA